MIKIIMHFPATDEIYEKEISFAEAWAIITLLEPMQTPGMSKFIKKWTGKDNASS